MRRILPFAVAVLFSVSALAELEEIVVTATKRPESLQDIAMSVQAVSGEALEALSIDDLQDLANSVPNFFVGDSLIVNNMTMRGIGSGEDRGFETPVSTFKDGIYMPRNRQTRSPFFDVDRVEVLRGPQAVLFGLNSSAGAIAIHGAVNNPGDETEVTLTGEYEAEYGGTRAKAVIGGSLGDNLGARLAIEHFDSGDGWLDNDLAGDSGASEHDLVRLSMVWEPTDNLKITARFEHNESEVDGQITELVNGELNLPSDGATGGYLQRAGIINGMIPGSWDLGGEDSDFNLRGHHSDDTFFQSLHAGIDLNNYRDPLGADQEMDNFSLNFEYGLGEYVLSGVIGRSDYEYDSAVNISGTTEAFYYGTNYEEYEQTSAEIRLASPIGQTVDWILGVYYHDGEMLTDQPNTMDINKFFGIFLGLPAAIVQAAVTGAPLTELAGSSLYQDTKLISPFASATWHVSDTFRVTAGVRYSDQEKDYLREGATANNGLYLTNPDGSLGPFLGGTILHAPGHATGTTTGTVDSSGTVPEVMFEWDMNSDVMFFGRYAESIKAGGVATAGSVALDGLVYDDEEAESIELGMKGRFLDGTAELNVTLFSTDYKDLQVKSSGVSASGVVTIIDNAGNATSEGVEIDGRIALNDWLIVGGNLAFLNAEYDSYPNGPCNRSGSTPAGVVPGTCDLKGESLPFAADSSGSVYFDIDKQINDGIRFLANLTVSFSDDYAVEGRNEPTLVQDSWTKVSGRIGIAASDDSWSLALVGRNLTDEETWLGGQPLFGYDMVYPGAPRTYAIQGVYRF